MPESSVVDLDQAARSRASTTSRFEVPDRFYFDGLLKSQVRKGDNQPKEKNNQANETEEVVAERKVRSRLVSSIDEVSQLLETEDYFKQDNPVQQEVRRQVRAYIINSLNARDNRKFVDKFNIKQMHKVVVACERAGLLTHSKVLPIVSERFIGLLSGNLTEQELHLADYVGDKIQVSGVQSRERGNLRLPKKIGARRKRRATVPARALEDLRLPRFPKGPQNVGQLINALKRAATASQALNRAKFKNLGSAREELKENIRGYIVATFTHPQSIHLMAKCKANEALRLYDQVSRTGAHEEPEVKHLMSQLINKLIREQDNCDRGTLSRARVLFFKHNPVPFATRSGRNLGLDASNVQRERELDSEGRAVYLQAGLLLGRRTPDLAERFFAATVVDCANEPFDTRKMRQLVWLIRQHGVKSEAIHRVVSKALKKDAASYSPRAFKGLLDLVTNKLNSPLSHRIFEMYIPRLETVSDPAIAVGLVNTAARENYANPKFYQPLLECVASKLDQLKPEQIGFLARSLGDMGLLTSKFASLLVKKMLTKVHSTQHASQARMPNIGPYANLMHGLEYAALISQEDGNEFEARLFRNEVKKVWEFSTTRDFRCSNVTAVSLAQFALATGRELTEELDGLAQEGFCDLRPGFTSRAEVDVGRVLKTLVRKGEKARGTIRNVQHGYRDPGVVAGLEIDFVFERKGEKYGLMVNGLPFHYRNRDLGCGNIGRDYFVKQALRNAGIIPLEVSDVEFYGTPVAKRVKFIAKRIKNAKSEAGSSEESTYGQTAA